MKERVEIPLPWWEQGCQRGLRLAAAQEGETGTETLNPKPWGLARMEGWAGLRSNGKLGFSRQGKDPQKVREWVQGVEVQG